MILNIIVDVEDVDPTLNDPQDVAHAILDTYYQDTSGDAVERSMGPAQRAVKLAGAEWAEVP